MSRKKNQATQFIDSADTTPTSPPQEAAAMPASEPLAQEPESNDHQEPARGKNWGPPYKAVFVSKAKGFEMGENRLYRQRVFVFAEKPEPDVIATLKENGFSYRPADKTWTIKADAATRALSDRLAREFAGQSQGMEMS